MKEREKHPRYPGIYVPGSLARDEREDEHDWFDYLEQNLSAHAGKDSPFPGSHWSYSSKNSAFEEEDHGHFGKGPKGWKRSDERIHEDVCEALYHSPAVDASHIEVFVLNGTVSLSGMVSSREEKKQAERLVESLLGVWDVHNELQILVPGK